MSFSRCYDNCSWPWLGFRCPTHRVQRTIILMMAKKQLLLDLSGSLELKLHPILGLFGSTVEKKLAFLDISGTISLKRIHM